MGGISQYILHLLPALAAIDGENTYQIYHSRKDQKDYTPENATNFGRKRLYTPCHHKIERWSLGMELLPQRLDLYHSPDFIPPAFGPRKRIITVHDLNFVHYPDFITSESRRYYLDQIEWAVGEADHIIADSDHTRGDLVELLGVHEDRVSTIYLAANPIYQERRSQEEIDQVLRRYDLAPGFLLFVGTVSPRKNVGALLKAYENLQNETQVRVPLILVGGRGWLSDDVFAEIERLSARFDIRHLENVSDYGCPVISSDRGSLPEIVGDAGVLLEPDDLASWTTSIRELLADEEKRKIAESKGRAQASSFSWGRAAAETLSLYQKIVDK
jgi:glycosyltransferase involved in cell wall biosynthesis